MATPGSWGIRVGVCVCVCVLLAIYVGWILFRCRVSFVLAALALKGEPFHHNLKGEPLKEQLQAPHPQRLTLKGTALVFVACLVFIIDEEMEQLRNI